MEQALVLARRSKDAQVLGPALLGRGSVLLEEGRRGEASTLAAEALEMGPRLVALANDTAVVHAAWLMRDLGLQTDYGSLLEASLATPWVRRGVGNLLRRAPARR